jgi:hypothetical protein
MGVSSDIRALLRQSSYPRSSGEEADKRIGRGFEPGVLAANAVA